MNAARILAALALVLAVAGALYFAFAGASTSESCFASGDSEMVCTRHSETLIEANGAWIIGYLLVPPVVTALGLAAISRRWNRGLTVTLASAFLFACLLTGFSIGLPFIPSALLLFIAAVLNPDGGHPQTARQDATSLRQH